MAEKVGKASTRAKNKWNGENYDRLYPYVKKGKKEKYLKATEVGGFDSLNDFMETAMDEKAEKLLGGKSE